MKKERSSVPLIPSFFWFVLFLVGTKICIGGLTPPNMGQITLYMLIPIAMFILNLFLFFLSRKIYTGYLVAFSITQILPYFLVFIFFSGGI